MLVGTGRTRALAEGLAAVLVWGASFIATKIALTEVSPATVVWLRFAMGVAVLGVAVTVSRQWATVSLRTFATFALLGLIGITFHQWLQSSALVTSRASTSGWIVATTPVFMAILGRLVLKERLGARRIAGIALAALGVVLVVTKGHPGDLLNGQFGAPGDILIVISAPNWALFSVLSRRALRSHPVVRMMAYVMGIGWLLSSVLLASGPGFSEISRLSARGWGAIVFLGLACSGLAYIAWYDALQKMTASAAGALLYLEPLVAMTVAAVVLGERVTAAGVAGGAVILFGVWLVNRSAESHVTGEAIALGPGEE
jgi:drug/metabolite transporter (DMT)-like permease